MIKKYSQKLWNNHFGFDIGFSYTFKSYVATKLKSDVCVQNIEVVSITLINNIILLN